MRVATGFTLLTADPMLGVDTHIGVPPTPCTPAAAYFPPSAPPTAPTILPAAMPPSSSSPVTVPQSSETDAMANAPASAMVDCDADDVALNNFHDLLLRRRFEYDPTHAFATTRVVTNASVYDEPPPLPFCEMELLDVASGATLHHPVSGVPLQLVSNEVNDFVRKTLMLCHATAELQPVTGSMLAPCAVLRIRGHRDAVYRAYAMVCGPSLHAARIHLSLVATATSGDGSARASCSNDAGFERMEDVAQALGSPSVSYSVGRAASWLERSFAVIMREQLVRAAGLPIVVLPYHLQPTAKMADTAPDPATRYAQGEWMHET